MDKVNILIVEDDSEQIRLLTEFLEKNNYQVATIAKTFKEALPAYLANTNIDMVIIDIFLDGHPEGITLAETINELNIPKKPFLFLTSSVDKKLFERAKATMPLNYMIKPFNELELLFAISTAVEKFYKQEDVFIDNKSDTVITPEYLYIQKGRGLKKVLITEIINIEVEGRYCNIITEKGKFVILISLTKLLELLSTNSFERVSRNFIINTAKIEEVYLNDNLILLTGGYKVTLSDKYKDVIKKSVVLK